MTHEDRKHADYLKQQAVCLTDHPETTVSLLTTAGISILRRRGGADGDRPQHHGAGRCRR